MWNPIAATKQFLTTLNGLQRLWLVWTVVLAVGSYSTLRITSPEPPPELETWGGALRDYYLQQLLDAERNADSYANVVKILKPEELADLKSRWDKWPGYDGNPPQKPAKIKLRFGEVELGPGTRPETFQKLVVAESERKVASMRSLYERSVDDRRVMLLRVWLFGSLLPYIGYKVLRWVQLGGF